MRRAVNSEDTGLNPVFVAYAGLVLIGKTWGFHPQVKSSNLLFRTNCILKERLK